MHQNEMLYELWAPCSSPWSAWAKPVLFAHLPVDGLNVKPPAGIEFPLLPVSDGQTAIVIDLPASASIGSVPALIRAGYRPVPVYNAVPGPALQVSAVEVTPIVHGLVAFSSVVRDAALSLDAPPAFLLDADRRIAQPGISVGPGVFDNRSVSLPTDFPSAGFLQSKGISGVVVYQSVFDSPQADLAHTLLRWQEAGVTISVGSIEDGGAPKEMAVKRPSGFRQFWQQMIATFGSRRHPLGGFGGTLPMPSAG